MAFRKPFRAVPIRVGRHYRAKRRRGALYSAAVLALAALVGGTVGVLAPLHQEVRLYGGGEVVSGCTVTDGDTIRCGDERIRLLGIDAPELPGHCRAGRDCAPGDPSAARESLRDAMIGDLHIVRVGEDRYGRTLATVRGDKGDVSCWQLQHAHAIYKPTWDNGGRVALTCPTAVLTGG